MCRAWCLTPTSDGSARNDSRLSLEHALLTSKDAGNHVMSADLLETYQPPNHVETLYRHSRLLL